MCYQEKMTSQTWKVKAVCRLLWLSNYSHKHMQVNWPWMNRPCAVCAMSKDTVILQRAWYNHNCYWNYLNICCRVPPVSSCPFFLLPYVCHYGICLSVQVHLFADAYKHNNSRIVNDTNTNVHDQIRCWITLVNKFAYKWAKLLGQALCLVIATELLSIISRWWWEIQCVLV